MSTLFVEKLKEKGFTDIQINEINKILEEICPKCLNDTRPCLCDYDSGYESN